MIDVLVTGGNGQLANNIKDLQQLYEDLNLVFVDLDIVDISDPMSLNSYFSAHRFQYCINCAAYTAVDKAEEEQKNAENVNVFGVRNLSEICKKYDIILIHISTDFVFDGNKTLPYTEEDLANPINVYGKSKLKGELTIKENLSKYFIIRTSWLYSEHNSNFMNTMISLSRSRKEISVVKDQIGSPTYAKDMAKFILDLISSQNYNYGLYNYSNEGQTSWYDFAKEIFDLINIEIKVLPIKTKDYPTLAKRPYFSVLDKSKTQEVFNIEIPHWRDSLKTAIKNYNNIRK